MATSKRRPADAPAYGTSVGSAADSFLRMQPNTFVSVKIIVSTWNVAPAKNVYNNLLLVIMLVVEVVTMVAVEVVIILVVEVVFIIVEFASEFAFLMLTCYCKYATGFGIQEISY